MSVFLMAIDPSFDCSKSNMHEMHVQCIKYRIIRHRRMRKHLKHHITVPNRLSVGRGSWYDMFLTGDREDLATYSSLSQPLDQFFSAIQSYKSRSAIVRE